MSLTAAEQLFVELVNRARLDPLGEAARQKLDLNVGLAKGAISPDAKMPLAPNDLLHVGAEDHGAWLLRTNSFSHSGINGSNAKDRMETAGYTFFGSWAWGENLSYVGSSGTLDQVAAIPHQFDSLWASPSHRITTMAGQFREIGLAQTVGPFSSGGTSYDTSMVVQKFATSGAKVYLTGVVINDRDKDKFYDVGEGLGGATITSGGVSAQTPTSGGYVLALDAHAKTAVTLKYKGKSRSFEVDLSSDNVKLDLLSTGEVLTSGHLTLKGGASDATVLGAEGVRLTGNSAANKLTGSLGNDTLNGGTGKDQLAGGKGDDLYLVDSTGDKVTEGRSTGRDTIEASVNYTLPSNVEVLVLKGAATIGTGNSAANLLVGNDARSHSLYGGGGNDTLEAGKGTAKLYGGDGNDRLIGQAKSDRLDGNAGNDTLYGGAGGDSLYGGGGTDRLYGDAGNDRLYGDSGNDRLYGGSGTDRLFGGTGNDLLDGGTGNDSLYGGAGADTFVFTKGSGRDTIYDFSQVAGDRLSLDDALWSGKRSAEKVVSSFATRDGDDIVLTFGKNSLRLVDVGDMDGLWSAIDII